ncbi:MAG: zinc-binding dehydrogenase, partial [Nevskiales bacterium]
LAQQCGADIVLDPAEDSPYSRWEEFGHMGRLPDMLELGVSTMENLTMLPGPWWHAWRLGERLGFMPKRPVIFECVGVPGIIQTILRGAPLMSRVVVVGVCMETDSFEPVMAINKEIDMRFVLGYTPLEYRDSLHMISEGKVECAHMVTGTVGLDGVAGAFDALGNPEAHAKILIDPKKKGKAIA